MTLRISSGYMLAAGALLLFFFPFVRHSGLTYDIGYEVIGLSSVVAIGAGAYRWRTPAPLAWLLIASGQLAFVLGHGVSIIDRVLGREVPSIADGFYLGGYPLIAGGLLVMIRRQSLGRDWACLIDAAIVTIGAAAVSWVFLMEPYVNDLSLSMREKLALIAYPMMDVLLLAVAAGMLITSGRRNRSFSFLAAALVFQSGGDVLYGLGEVQGWYANGSPVDLMMLCAYVLWGAAALHPSMVGLSRAGVDPEQRLTRKRIGMLTVSAFLAPAMMVPDAMGGSHIDLLVLVTASFVLFGLVIARLVGVVETHDRTVLREHVLREAAADLVAALSSEAIFEIAVRTASALAPRRNGMRAAIAVGAAAEMTVAAIAGAEIETSLGDGLAPSESVQWRLTELRSVTIKGDTPRGDALGLSRGETTMLFPILRPGGQLDLLTLRGRGELPPKVVHAIETLTSQVALALESAALTDDLLARQSEARFRSLVQNSSDLIMLLESDLTIRYATPSAMALLGYMPDELVGVCVTSLLDAEEQRSSLGELQRAGFATVIREFRLRRKDATWRTFESVWANLLDDPAVNGIVLTAHDVTERKSLEEQLMRQAFHDPLTNLANRALFADRVTQALKRRARRGRSVGVLFVDLDDFKIVNDTLGHAAGDELLVTVAGRVQDSVRPEDTCARLGGDEFAVLIGDTNQVEAEEVALRILEALVKPIKLIESDLSVRASIGVAIASRDQSVDDLLRSADVAMYKAKSDGKGRHATFQPSMHEAALERLALKADIQRAVKEEEFELHYQPIVRLDDGSLADLEALVRWARLNRGLIGPDHFIPIAEETGLIRPIGRWVLRRACEQAARWQQGLPAGRRLGINVNVSARELRDAQFVADVTSALDDSGLAPSLLTLEITESVVMGNSEETIECLRSLRSLGVRIAIDDFGTGFSSLSYLQNFPVDELKIAQHFVEPTSSADGGRIALAIIQLGQSLGLDVVAEGIETSLQHHRLRDLGCAFGQGYLFAPPLLEDAAAELVRQLATPSLVGVA